MGNLCAAEGSQRRPIGKIHYIRKYVSIRKGKRGLALNRDLSDSVPALSPETNSNRWN